MSELHPFEHYFKSRIVDKIVEYVRTPVVLAFMRDRRYICRAFELAIYRYPINGYLKSVAGTRFSLIARGEVQRIMLCRAPALSLVPEALAPPNGC